MPAGPRKGVYDPAHAMPPAKFPAIDVHNHVNDAAYQDRIRFETDCDTEEKMYANYFRWLETADEYFDSWGYPGRDARYGLALSDEI